MFTSHHSSALVDTHTSARDIVLSLSLSLYLPLLVFSPTLIFSLSSSSSSSSLPTLSLTSLPDMASSYSAVVSADKLPKLTPDNFVTWTMYITAALQERELWSYVGGVPLAQPPSTPASASTAMGPGDPNLAQDNAALKEVQDFINKDRKARAIIVLSVSEAMLIHTQPESMTAAQTWDKICAACQPKGMGTTYTLIRQLWNLRMHEGQRVQDHINQVEAICNKLTGIGQTVEPFLKSIALLGSLPPSWEPWVQVIVVRAVGPSDLDYTTICNLMIGEEQRRLIHQDGRQTEGAMATSTKPHRQVGGMRALLGQGAEESSTHSHQRPLLRPPS